MSNKIQVTIISVLYECGEDCQVENGIVSYPCSMKDELISLAKRDKFDVYESQDSTGRTCITSVFRNQNQCDATIALVWSFGNAKRVMQ